MGLLDFLFKPGEPAQKADAATGSAAIRKIADALGQMEPDRARYVASFSYILGRVANADLNISDEETREMERLVEGLAGLPEEQAILVVQIAKTQNVMFGGTDGFSVTEAFSQTATRAQKLALLNCLFAVSSSDHSISQVEDNEVRKISAELRLDHSDFIAARSLYLQHLEVLKKEEDD
jgi:uncharacterized tellurite resistance protein B-like protein